MLAGASAVAIGTALFVDPATPNKICDGLQQYLEKMKIPRLSDLVGALELPGDQPKTAPYP
jgi:dihydroorotate dehydrogenase (NAD+) catalytic subunit